jgi:hypothetical protein
MMLAASDGLVREKKNQVSALVLVGGAGGRIMHYDAWQWGSGCPRSPSVPFTTS